MGIFDKKAKGRRGEDFDSPIEQIDLSSAPEAAAEQAEASADETPPAQAPAAAATSQEAAASSPAPAKSKIIDQDYGIEEAIALMRTLPADAIELVVRVVKQTLESTHIDIPTIILDASAKQERITNRIGVLREEITGLEKQIADRSAEIGTLEADHEETSMVKERLELAEKLGSKDAASARSKLPSTAPKPAASAVAKK